MRVSLDYIFISLFIIFYRLICYSINKDLHRDIQIIQEQVCLAFLAKEVGMHCTTFCTGTSRRIKTKNKEILINTFILNFLIKLIFAIPIDLERELKYTAIKTFSNRGK